ncbi:MAG: DUF3618 domain-containing protein [Longimicrobiaceae bacterium]
MADYRNDDDDTLPGGLTGMNRTPETDPEHLIPDHTSAAAVPGTIAGGVSGDPDAVRDEIERTRARMSSTIDQIEGALQRKKGEIQEKLDVTAPVREKPWLFAAGVFGTGLALGLLTGGGGDDDRDHVKVPRALLAGMGLEEGGHTTGNGYAGGRERELMEVVARQEEEIRDLRAAIYGGDIGPEGDGFTAETELVGADALGEVEVEDEWNEEWNFDDGDDALDDFGAFGVEGERRGFLGKAVTAAVAAGLAGAMGGLGKKLVANRGRSGGMDVEVDLERSGGSATDVRVDPDYLEARREGYAGGEMDVEVDLERAYTGPEYGGRAQYGREMDVEVDLERGGGRRLPVSPLAGAVAAGAAALVGGLVARLVSNRSHREEMDVEVELEGRTAAPRQEMDVEVELEGHTSSPQPITAERTYEVELERPGGAPADPPMM